MIISAMNIMSHQTQNPTITRRSQLSRPALRSIHLTGLSLVLLLLVSGCSDATLSDLGRSSNWLEAAKPEETTTTTEAVGVPTRNLSTVGWWNLDLVELPVGETEEVIEQVYQRQPGEEFIQASPWEIAQVLPGLKFPTLVSDEVISITSQLVFSRGTAILGSRQQAAFGFWSAEPYTRSRSVAQRAVFSVVTPSEVGAACELLSTSETVSCRSEQLVGLDLLVREDASGTTWEWEDEDLAYRLFVRWPAQTGEVMLASLQPLSEALEEILGDAPAPQNA